MESDLRPSGQWFMCGIGMGHRACSYFTWMPDWQGVATESIVRFDLAENGGVTRPSDALRPYELEKV